MNYIEILGAAALAAPVLFLALAVTKPEAGRRFFRRSLFVLLPWFFLSLGWFASLGELGLLTPSQGLWMAALLLLVSESLGLLVSVGARRVLRGGRAKT